MNNNTVVRGLQVRFEHKADENLVRLLEETIYGTPGGILYRHHGTAEKIKSHRDLLFITIRRNNKIVATVGFCKRYTGIEPEHLSYYIRYLCFSKHFRSAGGSRSKKSTHRIDSRFQGKIASLLDEIGKDQSRKKLSYAFIEEANSRSRELSERFGYEVIRKYNTILFSCFFPTVNKKVSRITEAEKNEVRSLVRDQYRDHNFYFEDHLFYKNNYYLLRKEGEIIAGVQANPAEWEFHEIPGFSGFLMLNILPHIPVLNRLFRRKTRFIAFEALFVKKGFEDHVADLFESVCAMNKTNMGILWLDDKSTLYDSINNRRDFGLLKRLKKSAPVNILVRFDGYTEEEKKSFYSKPVYLSAFDMT